MKKTLGGDANTVHWL